MSRPALCPLPPPGEAPAPPFPGEEMSLGPRVLFVRRGGPARGVPAVFVHGLGGGSTNWTDLMVQLAGRLRCTAPDLPGFGRSAPPPGRDYSLNGHVDSVVALIERLGEAPVHLFGNSLGGAVVTRLAARYPALVRTLTLVSPALPTLRPPPALDRRFLLAALPGAGLFLRRMTAGVGVEDRARALAELCYYQPETIPLERRREAVEELARRSELPWDALALSRSLRGLVASYVRRGRRGLWAEAGRVAVPVLVIWGRHDRLVPVRLAARARRTFPDVRVVVFEDAGHVAMMEKPPETADEVARFLDL